MNRAPIGAIVCSGVSTKRLTRRAMSIVFLFVVLAGTLLFASPPAALAQDPTPITIEAEVGFNGKARVGHWIPVAVQLENQGGDFTGEVHVLGTGGRSDRYIADIVLPTNSRKRLTLYVPFLRASARLDVELVSDGKVVATLEPRVNMVGEDDLFVGVLGLRAGGWNLLTTVSAPGSRRQIVVATIPPDKFPHRPETLDAFDLIVVGDVQVQSLSTGMLEAMEGWVAGGGVLVLPGGPGAGANLKGMPERLMPVITGAAAELERSLALERLAHEPLPAAFTIPVIDSQPVSGQVLAQEGEVPLAVLKRYGQGSVLFLAFDPSAQPLVGWTGMSGMWKRLLEQSLPPSVLLPDQASGRGGNPRVPSVGWGYASGYRSQFSMYNTPSLEFPSIYVLLGLIGGYVLLVGPVNYLALRRLRRPGLTWLTVPVLALLFSATAYFLAVEAKGRDIQGSSISIIQEAQDTDWARVRRVVGVVAPSQGDYRVEVLGNTLVAPRDAIRGPSQSNPAVSVIKVRNGAEKSELELVDMGMWTAGSFWSHGVQRVEERLSHDLYIEGDYLKGTVTNRSSTAWKQVWLVAKGSMVDLGPLGPGNTVNVDLSLLAPAGGRPNWQEQLHRPSGPPPSNPREERLQHQARDAVRMALESYYSGSPKGLSVPIVAWTDEIPMGITVNGESPDGPSLTVLVKPTTPRVRGNFSIPRGLVMGRVVNFDGQTAESEPGKVVLQAGSATTFQFEVPTNIQDIERMALHVPSMGNPQGFGAVKALAYRWEKDTWAPLEMGTSAQPRGMSHYLLAYPQAPPGSAIFNPVPYGAAFNEQWAGELGNHTRHADYVSVSGLVRIKLVFNKVEVGVPSLIVKGAARE